jgi:polar amino acid transport system substrate-binding protein
MKGLAVAAATAFAAAAFAAWSVAAPSHHSASAAKKPPKPKLPALPAEVKKRGKWIIGVKCDFPPFGYIDVRGNNGGYDVEVAQRFAELAFGKKSKVQFDCVTTPSRIPTLMAKRVDIIVSTLTWTKARAEQIDFSVPYYSAVGRLLVPNNSPIKTLGDLAGKSVVTTTNSIYDRWLTNCFKQTKLVRVDGTAAAVLAVTDGRADTFMFDDAFVLGVATQNKALKLAAPKFLNVPWGIGIRKGETAMKKWVDAAIRAMKLRDEFLPILRRNTPKSYFKSFLDNVPRPKTQFKYPTGPDPETVCP